VSIRALGQVREARLTRHAQTLLDLSRRWDEPDMVEARKAVASYATSGDLRAAIDRFHRTNDDRYYVLMRVPNFLEDLAVLVDQVAEGCEGPSDDLRQLRAPEGAYAGADGMIAEDLGA
jgi:hypothetical protein